MCPRDYPSRTFIALLWRRSAFPLESLCGRRQIQSRRALWRLIHASFPTRRDELGACSGPPARRYGPVLFGRMRSADALQMFTRLGVLLLITPGFGPAVQFL